MKILLFFVMFLSLIACKISKDSSLEFRESDNFQENDKDTEKVKLAKIPPLYVGVAFNLSNEQKTSFIDKIKQKNPKSTQRKKPQMFGLIVAYSPDPQLVSTTESSMNLTGGPALGRIVAGVLKRQPGTITEVTTRALSNRRANNWLEIAKKQDLGEGAVIPERSVTAIGFKVPRITENESGLRSLLTNRQANSEISSRVWNMPELAVGSSDIQKASKLAELDGGSFYYSLSRYLGSNQRVLLIADIPENFGFGMKGKDSIIYNPNEVEHYIVLESGDSWNVHHFDPQKDSLELIASNLTDTEIRLHIDELHRLSKLEGVKNPFQKIGKSFKETSDQISLQKARRPFQASKEQLVSHLQTPTENLQLSTDTRKMLDAFEEGSDLHIEYKKAHEAGIGMNFLPSSWVEKVYGVSEADLLAQYQRMKPPELWTTKDIEETYQLYRKTGTDLPKANFKLVQGVPSSQVGLSGRSDGGVFTIASEFDFKDGLSSTATGVSNWPADPTQGPQALLASGPGALQVVAAVSAGKLPPGFVKLNLPELPNYYLGGYLDPSVITSRELKQSLVDSTSRKSMESYGILSNWAVHPISGKKVLNVYLAAPSFSNYKPKFFDEAGNKTLDGEISENLLIPQYIASAQLAVIRANSTGKKVTINLSPIGGGVFRNPDEVTQLAMEEVGKIVKGQNVEVIWHAHSSVDKKVLSSGSKNNFTLEEKSQDWFFDDKA